MFRNKMTTFIADLHNHTTASDGEYTPTELVFKAAELGLTAVGANGQALPDGRVVLAKTLVVEER